MKGPVPHGVDVRGFHSRLAPLQQKLDAELQAARSSLGARKLKAASLSQQVRQLRQEAAHAVAAATDLLRTRLDAGTHAQNLRHLVNLARHCSTREGEMRQAEDEVRDGMDDCVQRDRRLAVVQRIQDQELRAHAALVERRQRREADLDWLARTRRGHVPPSPGGGLE